MEVDILNLTKTSKFISLILRHKPETIGISLDEHGWANVDELVLGIAKTREFNMDILEEIVRTDEKQRYSFNIPKSRLYVHLSKDQETALKVGSRHGKPVLYIVKSREMYKDGYKFYLSKNGVWLTKEVPCKYLK